MGKYVYARLKAIIGHEGGTVRLYENEVWSADDPVVAAHPDQFSDVPVKVRRTTPEVETAVIDQPVETATAEPGVKRRTPRRV